MPHATHHIPPLRSPPAVPFLAELQLDGDGAVEAATHRLLHRLEKASGEDLSTYL